MTDSDDDLIEAVSRFAAERLRPAEASIAEADQVPDDIIADMRALGLYGLSVPQDWGGLGLSMATEARVIMAMGHASPAFRSCFGTNVGIGSQGIVMFGSDEQKARYLPAIADGSLVTSFALTEPEAGSDAASLRTRAVRDGEHWVLDGQKCYITNAGVAGLFTVMARTDPAMTGAGGVSAFLVPADTPGLRVGPSNPKMGQQGAHIHDVFFENCRVPGDAMLGAPGQGFGVAMKVLDRGRIHIAALCVGVAERLVADSLAWAQTRHQFGKPILEQQLVAAMLADSQTELLAARALVLDTARRQDAGEPITLEAAAAKLFASEMVGRVADRAVQIHGGAGYLTDVGIERLYRDVRIFRIYEGTSQVLQGVIARQMDRTGPRTS
ncbi:MAG: acyl-CoA dehydrogenase family protein [Hyphomonadaceae bacterium]|nr:acyl-CoA dehydrogenase family protein [Hyphomonadaceae bacterium]